MSNKNEMIEYKETIFCKIRNAFRKLFKRNEFDAINSNFEDVKKNEIVSSKIEEDKFVYSLESYIEEQRIKDIENDCYKISIDEIDDSKSKLNSRFNSLEEEIAYRKQKKFFLRVYKNIKDGKCDARNLHPQDLIKVMALLRSEGVK